MHRPCAKLTSWCGFYSRCNVVFSVWFNAVTAVQAVVVDSLQTVLIELCLKQSTEDISCENRRRKSFTKLLPIPKTPLTVSSLQDNSGSAKVSNRGLKSNMHEKKTSGNDLNCRCMTNLYDLA